MLWQIIVLYNMAKNVKTSQPLPAPSHFILDARQQRINVLMRSNKPDESW